MSSTALEIAQRLRVARKRAGMTQLQLALLTGIHRPNVSRIEAGLHTPSIATLQRLCAALRVSAADVLSPECPTKSACA